MSFHSRQNSGNVLVATICVTAIIAVALVSYLHLSSHQQRVTARSQTWNLCMPLAEAGVEEALTHCYLNYTNLSAEGWAPNALGDTYAKTNSLPQGHYEVQFTRNPPHVITSRGCARLPGVTNCMARTLQVVYNQNVIFKRAVNARGQVDLGGNNVLTDSYDSRDPLKSTNMRYDPLKRGDKGDLVCSNMVNVGNADIWGHVYTPPATSLDIGPNGSVGSLLFHTLSLLGLDPGWWVVTTNLDTYPSVKAPFTTGLSPRSAVVSGITYNQIFDYGNYVASSVSGNVLVTSNVVVYCSGSLNASFTILDGGSLKLYVRGPSFAVSSINNLNNYAGSCVFYALPNCNDFKMSGSANLTCAIYAPDANVTLSGGAQLSGAVVCKNFSMTGHSQFHFDEALASDPEHMVYEIQSWDEL